MKELASILYSKFLVFIVFSELLSIDTILSAFNSLGSKESILETTFSLILIVL
jgi:hypothetical protein